MLLVTMVETYPSMGLCYGFVCCEDRFPRAVDVSALSMCIVLRDFCCRDFYVFCCI